MRKAVAIPYIIALIIGVIVVAVLAYWFISSGGKGANVGKEAECTARKTEYCATQTDDVWKKMIDICGDKAWKENGQCYNFCSTIIPNWKALNDRELCKKQQQPQAK